MSDSYSTYEAKARFSEILRKVRGGQSVLVTYRGETVAEIRPVEQELSQEEKIRRLVQAGILAPAKRSHKGRLRPIADRPGALKRFLEERD